MEIAGRTKSNGAQVLFISAYTTPAMPKSLEALKFPVLRDTFDGGFLVERVAGIEQTR